MPAGGGAIPGGGMKPGGGGGIPFANGGAPFGGGITATGPDGGGGAGATTVAAATGFASTRPIKALCAASCALASAGVSGI